MRWIVGVAALAVSASLFIACGEDKPASSVTVKLNSFTVAANKTEVPAGPVTFIATNAHEKEIHELAVLRVKADGSFENLGEVEDIDPGKGGEVTMTLKPGKYVLACLIAAGEAGSTVDHFAYGMRQDFQVR